MGSGLPDGGSFPYRMALRQLSLTEEKCHNLLVGIQDGRSESRQRAAAEETTAGREAGRRPGRWRARNSGSLASEHCEGKPCWYTPHRHVQDKIPNGAPLLKTTGVFQRRAGSS